MRAGKHWAVALAVAFTLAAALIAQPAAYLYKTTLVQAAPGKLKELIELYKQKAAADSQIGEPAAFWMRHSQGDHWDLLLLTPVGSYADYFKAERIARRTGAETKSGWKERSLALIAWQEDVYVTGPPLEELRKALAGNTFFHVEMFHALAGKHAELRREREMENAYLKTLGRPRNFIFARDQGAAWDLFTLGVYRDLKHYAESADIPEAQQEAAARAAGFASASDIGPYLRALISSHHDTLASAIR
jgi:hypothetical protein